MKKLVCIGSGALARQVTSLIKEHKELRNFSHYSFCFSSPAYGDSDLFPPISSLPEKFYYIIAIGNPHWRSTIIEKLQQNNNFSAIPINLIHPFAYVSESAIINKDSGIIVFPNAVIMNKAIISSYSVIGSGSIIEHDSVVGFNCTICPNVTVCGNVTLEENCCIGAGSTIMQQMKIEHSCMVGAHSLINTNMPPLTLSYGVPAKQIRKIDSSFNFF